jgi:citrate synthase
MLDLLMITQAEHGGGNNSTFTVRVTRSTQTDIYSSITAGIGSLKGRLHGGANMMVADMFCHLWRVIKNWEDDEEIDQYLMRMLHGEAYDESGLIYGFGHAVYTLSDPWVMTLKRMAYVLMAGKGY